MRYLFADCLLDTQLYTLYRAGLAVPLRPKAFHVLHYLLEHRDHLVSKEELCAHVWPAQFISDATIEGCINHARQAIGDTGRAQQLIQTRRGYGYRFVGAVEERSETHAAQEPTATLRPSPTTPTQDDTRRRPDPTRLPGEDPVASCAGAASPAPRSSLSPRAASEIPVQGVPAGERKLVTLLGCTLAHAAALRERWGLDALHSRMRTLYTLTQQVVHQYGGTLHTVAGTRLLAIFGAPVAQEDHARRALLAAWELHQRLAAYQGGGLAEEVLTACLGLHTGLMVVGGIGDGQAPAAVVGNLILAVEALQERAVPGMLLCSEATARLVRRDVCLEAVAPVPIPGQPTPLRTYQVMELRPQDVSRTQAELRARSPFVGRAHELATLQAVLAQVVGGRGQVVGIVGEPGMGKSRLLAEWHQQLRAHGVTYLQGHCLSYGSNTPYLPVLDLLRAHCGITLADGVDAITEKVYRGLQAVGLAPDARAPYLLHLLGVGATTAQVAGVSPDTLKAKTFAILRQLWFQSSQRHPLILAVEDLHWIDPTSEEFFASLVEGLPGASLLLLGTYRPGYRPPWIEKSYATQLTLPPLSAQDSVQVVQAVLQRETVPPPLAETLLAKAQGNPLFLEELAQTLVEQGVLRGETTSRAPLPTPSLTDLQLPPTVQGVLAARIDGLSREDKHLLQCAAVIGTDVPVPLLQAIAELPEAALYRSLAHLQAAEFLYETRFFPDYAYTFKHALTHEVAYSSLLQKRRRALHTRIVEALERLAPDRLAEQVEHLAHHAVRGAVWDKALAYCRQAGARAAARSAYREAVACFEQALAALAQLPEHRDTLEQAIDLRWDLRNALHPLGEQARSFDHLRAAEALAERLGDDQRLGRIVASLGVYFVTMGAYDRALAAGQRALALATTSGAFDVQVLAQTNLSLAYSAVGDFGQMLDVSRRVMALLTGERRYARIGPVGPSFGVISRGHVTWSLAELGGFAEGTGVGEDAVQLAEAVEQPYNIASALMWLGLLYCRQGVLHRAIAVLERGLALCQTVHVPLFFPLITSVLGAAYALTGHTAEALPLLDQTLERVASGGRMFAHELVLTELSKALLLVGRVDEASALAGRLLALSRTHTGRGYQAHACRLLGDVAIRRNPPEREQAEAHYRQALALAEELGMRPLQAHCHRGLGTLYATTSQREQARAELSTAIALYRTMDMTFWLPQAEATLAQVEGP